MPAIIKTRHKNWLAEALQALRLGQAVVYPTDTAYGLGVDATNSKAVAALLRIKERRNQPVHIVVSSLEMAKKYVEFNKTAIKLFKKFLPGPLTLVCAVSPNLSPRQERVVKLLSAGTGTLGIRMPENKVALTLVKKFGRPITTPSANPSAHRSGGTTPYSVTDSYQQFRNKKYQPDLYLDAGRLPKRKPSTMVKLTDGKVEILRHGPISEKQLNASL